MGLFPIFFSEDPHGGMSAMVLVQQIPMHPAAADCNP